MREFEGPAVRTSFLWGLLALVLYAGLRQETFYSSDAHGFLLAVRGGESHLAFHLAYLPAIHALASLLTPLGLSGYEIASWFDVVVAAVGIAFAHAAFRLWFDERWRAHLATALLTSLPSLVFYASVVELHALQFAACGPAWLLAAAYVRSPSHRRAALLGVASGLALVGHATSVLLPLAVVPVVAVSARSRGGEWRQLLRHSASCAGFGAATALAVVACVYGRGVFAVSESAADYALCRHVDEIASRPVLFLQSFARDFAVPCFAASVLFFAAWFQRGTRPLAAAMSPAVVTFCAATTFLLGDGTEYGAYFTPLHFFVVLVAASLSVPRPILWGAVVVSMLSAVVHVVGHDRGEDRGYVASFVGLRGDANVLLVAGTHAEVASLLLDDERGTWTHAIELLRLGDADRAAAAALAVVADARNRGSEVWLTDGATAWLRDNSPTGGGRTGQLVLQQLEAAYELLPRRSGTFSASVLVPRTSPAVPPSPR